MNFCEMLWVNLHLLWRLQNLMTALYKVAYYNFIIIIIITVSTPMQMFLGAFFMHSFPTNIC